MTNQHYSLNDVLDEAEYVRVTDDSSRIVIWYGGPMFEVYGVVDDSFIVLESITIGKGDTSEITQEEAEKSIEEYMKNLEFDADEQQE